MLKGPCDEADTAGLGEEEREVIRTLQEQLLQELAAGGARPMWSILRQLSTMATADVEGIIDLYEQATRKPSNDQGLDAAGPPPGLPPPPPPIPEQWTWSKESWSGWHDKGDDKAGDASSSWNGYQSQVGSHNYSSPDSTQKKGKGSAAINDEEGPPKGKEGKSKGKDGKDDGKDGKDGKGKGKKGKDNPPTDGWRADRNSAADVLEECRTTMAESERMLLSQLGASLSQGSRAYLDSKNMKLKRFLAGYPDEFTVEESWNGRDQVTHTFWSESGSVLTECRSKLASMPNRRMLLSKMGASMSSQARAYLDRNNIKLKRFLQKHPDEFVIEDIGDGRDSVVLVSSSGEGGGEGDGQRKTEKSEEKSDEKVPIMDARNFQ